MPTTTIRLPEALKARIASATARTGITSHSFILQAIAEKAEQVELRSDFDQVAEERYARIAETEKTIPWQEMRRYLDSRLTGKKTKPPSAKKLAR
jgi:uncharacterized protein (DUF1778 family)